jgi:hypothetical protein
MYLQVCDGVCVRLYVFADRGMRVALVPDIDRRAMRSILGVLNSSGEEVFFGVADKG